MKKLVALLSVVFFAVAILAFAAEELRPAQKAMQARAAWMAAMSKNLGDKNFDAIAKDANDMAAQTKKIGDSQPNPLAKDLTLAISSLAKDISGAAAQKDGATVKVKLGEIKGKCGECHTKIRDKK